MKMGIIGLGRMGAGIAERLRREGHEVTGYDQNPSVSQVASIKALVESLPAPRAVWLMVPAGDATQATIDELLGLMSSGDIIIDGGNSYYKDSVRRARQVEEKGLSYLDIGTSGGIWGLENGFCLMIGGPKEAFSRIEPLIASLAPKDGYAYLGPSGAGHYAKMIHNGIEYGLLQAYAEGFHLLEASDYEYNFGEIASLWNHGSVVRSWLLELAEDAFAKDPRLTQLRGYVDDSGEGRWTALEAIDRGVAAPVITEALYARFTSRDDNAFSARVIAALRNEFGGHQVQKA
jgi:6-phosphogluconate dehydrogenase